MKTTFVYDASQADRIAAYIDEHINFADWTGNRDGLEAELNRIFTGPQDPRYISDVLWDAEEADCFLA